MGDAIFITGGTGFLGTEILEDLLLTSSTALYVLVRASSKEAAIHRLKAAWYHSETLYAAIDKNIIPVTGDFTLPDLGLAPAVREELQKNVTLIIHSGAEIGFQAGEKELTTVNLKGTENMLSFAKELPSLKRFLHISTAYVAGQSSDTVYELPSMAKDFSSLYEKSKKEAEDLVMASSLPWTICRPGMIVGNSKNGRVKSFNTIYYVLKQVLLGKMPVLPVRKDMGLNLVPVDYVAGAVSKLALNYLSDDTPEKGASLPIYHLTCPKEMQPTAGELMSYVLTWAKKNLNITLAPPVYKPVAALKKAGLSYNQKKEDRTRSPITNLLTLLPYFMADLDFDRTHTDALFGSYTLNWKDYIDVLLDFACRKNFMQQTERTVFEQANVRRASSHYPVTYHDVKADEITDMDGESVNQTISKILSALFSWGLRKGDKIAMSGINSTDYMMLDQAIGLLGGVTVPIYYTTPKEEVELLLAKSGAKWFFVGDQRIRKATMDLQSDVQIVTFSVADSMPSENAMNWETFLAKGSESSGPVSAPGPDPDDLATIRYTSGTTGEPKGVMFNYHQLSWMGEVLTNLLSWKGRNKEMRYLSFLPESHVVEGILASYAPYYMLAKVDFYFLNDFGALVDALPKVRPTVFFSVPRFYEKLWDQLLANKIGQKYVTMPEGPLKKATAALLKTVILKKAGLDQCEQLIVGSAPISEALLLNFRALGIEIHNAYGQTEAPLITINRMGHNVIPTIGTPLPETIVTVEEDGELIVKGPQVSLGYYGLPSETIQNGVLRTGDLGSIDAEGNITLYGRKKEMIITAYGKNISTPKIEERLKNIPCVSEAVLIGENRPYCTALLWVEGDASHLDEEIEAMNGGLSHPEQVKKYRIIETPLSIQKGELTPNLKVKRGNVEAHYQSEIQEMYP